VLVDAEDALSDRIVEPGAARDVSSALAPQLLDAVPVGSATRERDETAQAKRQWLV
jgi:hypothetical protein